jgi:ABC-2 type transport system permease protein
MNHLPLIIKREYLTKVRNKSFILMTFLSPLVMIGLFFFVGYLSNVNNDTVRTIYVLDETSFLSETLKTNDQTIYTHLSDLDVETAKILANQE